MSGAAFLRRPILVVGGTGQIGFELIRELAPLGSVAAPLKSELNLSDPACIQRSVKQLNPRLIVNAAAYTAVDRAETDVAVAEAVNATAAGILATEARKIGAAFIHYSTDYVFDGAKTAAYVESDATNPLNAYGRTKLNGEQAVGNEGGAWVVFRCSWVYSRRGHNFLRTVLRLADEGNDLTIVSDQRGAPTWARMIAAATAAVVAQGSASAEGLTEFLRARAGVYHLSAAGSTTWSGFAQAILRECDMSGVSVREIKTSEYPTAAKRPQHSVLDNSRVAEVFSIFLPHWETQLRLFKADYLHNSG